MNLMDDATQKDYITNAIARFVDGFVILDSGDKRAIYAALFLTECQKSGMNHNDIVRDFDRLYEIWDEYVGVNDDES